MRLWVRTGSLPEQAPGLSEWKRSLFPVFLKSCQTSAGQFCKRRVRNAVNRKSIEWTENGLRMMTSYSCSLLSRSCTGLRLSSGSLSRLKVWVLHWSKALFMSSTSFESCIAFGSSWRLFPGTEDDQVEQLYSNIWRSSNFNPISSNSSNNCACSCYFFLPALFTLTTSAPGFFRDAISADLLFFSSLKSLSRLNTEHRVKSCKIWSGRNSC